MLAKRPEPEVAEDALTVVPAASPSPIRQAVTVPTVVMEPGSPALESDKPLAPGPQLKWLKATASKGMSCFCAD